ncbi:3-ketoacyl-ACP reductase [Paenibacillus antibioticophila]|uniref:3-ketoacyl-ACP reductase n=1 Tax=Paenibacillus antibioticophila TaxID=1274374 RepID=A0A919XUM5_9BACL|nr:SDR family oxidoreductase [Paenibacillus antibioticophila]GIO37200.1 3-ketoacyl-ACP reductase [Paenibacillus antibioticophila]
MKLSGKVAVVTGAASGMGKAIAELYAAEGAKVVVADLSVENAGKVVEGIEAKGGTAFAIASNVAKEEDVQRLIDETVSRYGTVDILVNNAGIMDNFVPAGDLSDELWEKVFAVNTTGPMRTIRKVLPLFIEKKAGVIVNIASVGGLFGSRAGAAYTASKHAVIGLTKNVGFQYAQLGIRCNAIAPGAVQTNIGASLTAVNPFGAERAQIGMGINPGMGQPEDIANIALFLASDDSSFVNGTTITADAGWTAY